MTRTHELTVKHYARKRDVPECWVATCTCRFGVVDVSERLVRNVAQSHADRHGIEVPV